METKKIYNTHEQSLPELREEMLAPAASHAAAGSLSTPATQAFPCSFSDEEWKEEIRMSEESGIATEQETANFYKKWGIAL